MLKGEGLSDIALDIVLHHHENEVGSGYPDWSTDMNFETKLVSIADKFDAITESRPYHDKCTVFYKAIQEMSIFLGQFCDSEILYNALYECKDI